MIVRSVTPISNPPGARGSARTSPVIVHGRLRRQLREALPDLRRQLVLHEHRLADAGAVAQHGEGDLAGRAEVRHPRANDDGLADVRGELGDANEWSGGHVAECRASGAAPAPRLESRADARAGAVSTAARLGLSHQWYTPAGCGSKGLDGGLLAPSDSTPVRTRFAHDPAREARPRPRHHRRRPRRAAARGRAMRSSRLQTRGRRAARRRVQGVARPRPVCATRWATFARARSRSASCKTDTAHEQLHGRAIAHARQLRRLARPLRARQRPRSEIRTVARVDRAAGARRGVRARWPSERDDRRLASRERLRAPALARRRVARFAPRSASCARDTRAARRRARRTPSTRPSSSRSAALVARAAPRRRSSPSGSRARSAGRSGRCERGHARRRRRRSRPPARALDATRDDEFGRLAASFRAMSRQLAELDKLKAEFVSVASHELKTPINVILGYLQLMRGRHLRPAHPTSRLEVHADASRRRRTRSRGSPRSCSTSAASRRAAAASSRGRSSSPTCSTSSSAPSTCSPCSATSTSASTTADGSPRRGRSGTWTASTR